MYPSTEMFISVQKYKLQYRKISPILSTQITALVQKNYQSLSTKTYTSHSFVSVHLRWKVTKTIACSRRSDSGERCEVKRSAKK